MRVLLCGGGTAGHVMPAIAIAEIIEKAYPDSVIAFAGRCGGGENKAYLDTGRKLYTVEISGISRSLTPNNIKTIFKLLKSSRNARAIINEFRPDLIIGTGGYVCYPFIRQGQRLGIKTAIHESNIYAGLVTKMLGRKCDKLLLNFEGTKKYLKNTNNVEVVGNPIRNRFGTMTKKEARRRLGISDKEILIVSFGGSLGAKLINDYILEFISKYVLSDKRIRHIHSTGRSYYSKIKEDHPKLFNRASNASIVPYIEDMPLFLTAADLAITRSGAMTVSELCRSATPSILIPSPNVTANHQYKNAQYMQSIGAAVLIEEKELTAERLGMEIFALINNEDAIGKMSQNAYASSPKNTDKLILKALRSISSPK